MSATTGTKDNLLVIRNNTSGYNFLIDTGADISILPASSRDIKNLQQTRLLPAPDGKSIPSFGTRLFFFVLESTKYSWSFIIAAVKRPILGADFLNENGILVNVERERLINSSTYNITSIIPRRKSLMNVEDNPAPGNVFENILADLKYITFFFSHSSPKHNMTHFIITTGPPLHARARRLSPDKLAVAKAEFSAMEEMGTMVGVHVVTIADSTRLRHLIDTPFPTSKTSCRGWREQKSFQQSTASVVTNRSPCERKIFRSLQLSPNSDSTNSSVYRLDWKKHGASFPATHAYSLLRPQIRLRLPRRHSHCKKN